MHVLWPNAVISAPGSSMAIGKGSNFHKWKDGPILIQNLPGNSQDENGENQENGKSSFTQPPNDSDKEGLAQGPGVGKHAGLDCDLHSCLAQQSELPEPR